MKPLKIVLVVIVAIVATVLIAAALMKKEYSVEEEITINKPKSEVFEYIRYLKNQDNFSKWASMDPDMQKSYRGTDGTVGFVSAWSSDNEDVGSGEQEIINIDEGNKIDYELRFFSPWEGVSPAYLTTESISDNQTKVAWGFSGSMPYPGNIMITLMDFESMIAADFQTGLTNLKNILEK